MESEKQSFFVQADDNRKFKMVIRGDVSKIPVEKIRRYLKSYGIPDGQTLMFGDTVLTDDMIGEDFGLQPDDVLHLAPPQASLSSTQRPSSVSGSNNPSLAAPSSSWSRQSAEPQADAEGRRRQQQQAAPVRQAPSLPMDSSPGYAAPRSTMQEARMAHRANAANTPPPSNGAQTRSGAGAYSSPDRSSYTDPVYNNSVTHNHHHHSSMPVRGAGGVHQQERELLEVENGQLRREVEAMRLELEAARMSNKQVNPVESLLENAKRNLLELGKDIGMHLVLDQQLSCVIGTDERHTLLLSFDAPTERLYIFSSLLSAIPADPQIRMRLYETLLEGAFLGRDMAGGGCGLSLQSGILMMSTSIQLRHCSPHALKDVVPVFIESLMRWRGAVEQIVNGH